MPEPLPHLDEAHAGLERHFGLQEFRPGQAEVISAVLSGRNAVVIMPTGAGKSLCYQLPALLLPRLTLVISPLIALMKDQVDALTQKGIAATFVNSTLSDLDRARRLDGIRSGAYRIVYVAPERFRSPSFLELIASVGVDLLAIDEAHCISQWGHDFRPDYAQLGQVRKRLRPPRTVALTATATPEVRDDIVRSLLMKDPKVFVAGFDRPNLFLEVVSISGDDERRGAIEARVEAGGSGIVYCSTRKSAEMIHQTLRKRRRPAVLYHAGMEENARREAQEQFMGTADAVAVATNAFGMGIDKPDIRFVVHAHIPRAVEAYYQEIGRGGRDGGPAHALLLFNHADVFTQERLVQSNHPSEATFADVWGVLQGVEQFDRGVHSLADQVGASEFEVSAALRIFEREGRIERTHRGESAWGLTLTPRAEEVQPHAPDAKTLLSALRGAASPGDRVSYELAALTRRTGLTSDALRHAIGLLERARAVTVRRPLSGKSVRATQRVPFRELGLDLARVREQERQSLLLLKRMTDYAYHPRCRRRFLLRYFGEAQGTDECGTCDVCAGARTRLRSTPGARAQGAEALPFGPSRRAPVRGARGAVSSRSRTKPAGVPTGVSAPPGPYSEVAAMELRQWRKELSRELEVPAFIIFNDKTLLGLASALPTDRASFLAVKGTGESRWERFGAQVVEICFRAAEAAIAVSNGSEVRAEAPIAVARAPSGTP